MAPAAILVWSGPRVVEPICDMAVPTDCQRSKRRTGGVTRSFGVALAADSVPLGSRLCMEVAVWRSLLTESGDIQGGIVYHAPMTYLRTASLAASIACASLAAVIALPSLAKESKLTAKEKGEAELAEILEGYVAGEPVNCLRRTQHDRLRVVDDTAFVFRDRGTIYVNRTNSPRYLNDFDIPVFKPFSGRLCRSDQVEMVDRLGGAGGPIVILKQFIPYTKVKSES